MKGAAAAREPAEEGDCLDIVVGCQSFTDHLAKVFGQVVDLHADDESTGCRDGEPLVYVPMDLVDADAHRSGSASANSMQALFQSLPW